MGTTKPFARIASAQSLRQLHGMNAPLVRLSAIIILALLATSRAEQAGKPEDKAKLVTRVYRVPSSMFFSTLPELDGKKTDSGTKPKELPVAADGEMRYDAWRFLEASGVEKTPGSEAILLKDSNALVVTTSAEMQDLVERIIEIPCCGSVKSVETIASLWEYEDDQFADVIPGLRSFAELRQRAGNSLKLLASQFIATKSGQRATAASKQPDTARAPVAVSETKPTTGTPSETVSRIGLNGARGSFFEVEPTIGPDGEMVDMAISFEARLRGAGTEHDTEVSVTTNLTLSNNHDTIPYYSHGGEDGALVQKGKVKRHALVIGVRVVGVDGRTGEEVVKQRKQEDEQLIRKAHAGIGVPKK
jgi:hypothetical protein